MTFFLEAYDGSDRPGQAMLTQTWLRDRPFELFAELRSTRPILVSPIGVLVSRYQDVHEVLTRHQELSVKPYGLKMERITGPFILGMGDSPRYRSELAVMRLAFPDPDVTDLATSFATWAEEAIAKCRSDGAIDVVSCLTRHIPTRFVNELVGVMGSSEEALQRWARTIFRDIFINIADDVDIRQAADQSAAEMREHLDDLIEKHRVGGNLSPDTVVGKLIAMQNSPATHLSSEAIRHNLIGMIVGIIDTTSKAAAYAIDWLLDKPAALAQIRQADEDGNRQLFLHCLFEAMRFKPQSTSLIRLCEQEVTLAVGHPWETQVRPGQLIFAGTWSAMFDASAFPSPEQFLTNRPLSSYLHFGLGQHQCFGRYINAVQIGEIVRSVIRLPGLQRIQGSDGQIQHDGPFPSKLVVSFDP